MGDGDTEMETAEDDTGHQKTRAAAKKKRSVLVQTLTITNEATGKSCTTTRYFVPHRMVETVASSSAATGQQTDDADAAMQTS